MALSSLKVPLALEKMIIKQQALKSFFGSVMTAVLGFAIGIVALYGWQYANQPPTVIEMDTSAHFAATDKRLILYSASWCQYCDKVKNYLNKHQLVFENRDIESADLKVQQLFQTLGAEGIPQILIGNKVIRGADLAALEDELKKRQLL